jgi:hypothetical protein
MRRVVGLFGAVAMAAAMLVVVTAAPSGAVITCEKTWTNPGTSGVWEDPGVQDHLETQWTPTGVPQMTDQVCLPAGSYTVSIVAVPNFVEALKIGASGGGSQPTLAITGAGQAVTMGVLGEVENRGTLRIGHATLESDLAITFGGAFMNSSTIDLIQGGGGMRTLDGAGAGTLTNTGTLRSSATGGRWRCATVTSTGTIDVDPGKQLDLASGGCGALTLTVTGGSVINDGTLGTAGGLSVNSAAITGANPIYLAGGPLSFTGSASGKVTAWEATIAGTIPTGVEVLVDDLFDPGHTGFLTATGPVTNNGTVRLTGTDFAAAYIISEPHTFTNNGSVLLTQSGLGGSRGIRTEDGNFVNNGLLRSSSPEGDYCGTITNQAGGTIDVDAGADLSPHGFCSEDALRLLGGTVINDGSLRADDELTIGGNANVGGTGTQNPLHQTGGTLGFQPGSTAQGEIDIVQNGIMDGGGAIPQGITVNVIAQFSPVSLATGASWTNNGTLRFTSEGSALSSSFAFEGGSFTNNGVLELLAGSGGQRSLAAQAPGATLQNNGLVHVATPDARICFPTVANNANGVVDVDPGAVLDSATCGVAPPLAINGGTVNVDGTLQISPITMNGGRLTGSEGTVEGNVTNSGGTVAPGNSISTLVIDGTYTQGAGGRLEIETGPGPQIVDVLGVEGNVTLNGTLHVDAAAVVPTASQFVVSNGIRTGTFTNVRGVPDPWVTYPFANTATIQSVVTFPDVPLSHQFFLDIAWAAGEGIVNGFADGTFKPGATATRQAVVAMLYRLSGSPDGANPTCSSAPFSDVGVSHAFCGEIDWASDEGLVNGFSDGTFRPANTITRQALMAIIYRMAGSPDGPDPTCASAPFSDVGTNHAFCGEIEWAKLEGLANGFADGSFKPANTLSRQAIAAFLHRFSDGGFLD